MYGNPEVFENQSMSLSSATGGQSASVGGIDSSQATGAVDTGSLSTMLKTAAEGKSSNYLYTAMIIRASNSNVIPLIALLCLVVVGQLLKIFWRELPFYWIGKLLGMMCRKKNRVYIAADDEDDRPVKDTQEALSEGKDGAESSSVVPIPAPKSVTIEAIEAYELHKRHDPLRLDTAPFTGHYYKYIRDKEERVSCLAKCTCCCNYDPEDVLTEEDVNNGWEIADQGDRYVMVFVSVDSCSYLTLPYHPNPTLYEDMLSRSRPGIVPVFTSAPFTKAGIPNEPMR